MQSLSAAAAACFDMAHNPYRNSGRYNMGFLFSACLLANWVVPKVGKGAEKGYKQLERGMPLRTVAKIRSSFTHLDS